MIAIEQNTFVVGQKAWRYIDDIRRATFQQIPVEHQPTSLYLGTVCLIGQWRQRCDDRFDAVSIEGGQQLFEIVFHVDHFVTVQQIHAAQIDDAFRTDLAQRCQCVNATDRIADSLTGHTQTASSHFLSCDLKIKQ